jgi:hypothetical protein
MRGVSRTTMDLFTGKKVPMSCANCKYRTGTRCRKYEMTVSLYDWCSAWRRERA